MSARPYVWQMIKEAVENLGGHASYSQIKEYIKSKYGDVNESTINAQIIVCTVNQPSRIHYPENKKSRVATDSRYDFLFTTGRGQVELYNPAKHGIWEIRENEYGRQVVTQRQAGEASVPPVESGADSEIESETTGGLSFPLESHLRDFIVKNLDSIRLNGKRLQLYSDPQGRDGVEYPTDVGPIDVLATDEDNNLVVFELKVSKGADRTIGQILRYMGWVKKHLASNRGVKGAIVAHAISEQLKYAVSVTPGISLFEYQISFSIKPVSIED